jgi:hypothetical protein
VHYFKVVHYIGNMGLFGTQTIDGYKKTTHFDWYGLRLAMGTTLEDPPGVLGIADRGMAFFPPNSLLGPLFMVPNDR